jgi:membrane-associated phospholipid phosphatase
VNPLLALDVHVLHALYAARQMQWVFASIWVSELGRATTVLGLAAALALLLSLRRRFALAQGLVLSVVTSGIATFILKGLVARARPPQEYWAYAETWYSFPSAHAAMSVAFWGFVAYIVFRTVRHRSVRALALFLTALLILAVGFSRLYLGVHYLSDVVAGYMLGGACLSLGIWATRSLSRDRMSA